MKFSTYLVAFFIFSITFSFGQDAYVDSLNNLLSKEKADTNKIKFLNLIGRKWRQSNPKLALEKYNEALSLASKTNYAQGKFISLINIAKLHFSQGNYQAGIDSFIQPAFQIAKEKNRSNDIAEALNLHGEALNTQGKYTEALKKLQDALSIEEANKDLNDIAKIKINIGNVYNYLGQYAVAMKNYKAAYENKKEIKDGIGQITCLVNMAGMASILKDFPSSITYSKEAERICLQTNAYAYLPYAYQNISNTFLKINQPDSALVYYDKAFKIQEKLSDVNGQAAALNGKANVLMTLKKYPQALEVIKKSVGLSVKSNQPTTIMDAYDVMGMIHFKLGNFREAYLANKIFDSIKTSLINSETAQQINELQVKYETVKKDKELIARESEIKLQQKENKQRALERNGFIIGFITMIALALIIFRGYRNKKNANHQIQLQKELVEEKQKEILDSINYAKRIQKAHLPTDKYIEKNMGRLKKS